MTHNWKERLSLCMLTAGGTWFVLVVTELLG